MAEQKKSVVTAVTPNGSWDSQYGTFYRFEVAFQNGDAGEYSSKSQEQTKFVLGQEIEYELKATDYGNKIKPSAPAFNGGGGGGGYKKDPATEKRIVRMNVLQRSIDLALHERITLDEVVLYAEALEKWVHGESVQLPQKYANANDLPFS